MHKKKDTPMLACITHICIYKRTQLSLILNEFFFLKGDGFAVQSRIKIKSTWKIWDKSLISLDWKGTLKADA